MFRVVLLLLGIADIDLGEVVFEYFGLDVHLDIFEADIVMANIVLLK